MTEKENASKPGFDENWIDPDDAPELTDEYFERAALYDGGKLVSRGRGRPRSDDPKQQVTLRIDRELLEALRASGPGWQSRVNEAIRKLVEKSVV